MLLIPIMHRTSMYRASPVPSPVPGHQTWESPALDPQTSDFGPLPALPSLLVTSGCHHWRPVQTCSFEDPQELHLVAATEARTVFKWLVRILQECFLVFTGGGRESAWRSAPWRMRTESRATTRGPHPTTSAPSPLASPTLLPFSTTRKLLKNFKNIIFTSEIQSSFSI